jgi:hypothetical protein
MSVCLSVCLLSVCLLSVFCLSFCLSIGLSVYLFVYSFYRSVCLSIIFFYRPAYMFCLSVCRSIKHTLLTCRYIVKLLLHSRSNAQRMSYLVFKSSRCTLNILIVLDTVELVMIRNKAIIEVV